MTTPPQLHAAPAPHPARAARTTILVAGPQYGAAQSVGDMLARSGATCLSAESLAELARAFARSPAQAVLIDAPVLARDGAGAIAAVAANWPSARRIAIGGWPPVSPERLDFHVPAADTPATLTRAVGLVRRLATATPEAETSPGPVLVIDDMRTMRDLATCMLEQDGFVAHAVGTVEEAHAHLDRVRYAAVLTDVFMAGIGGIEGIQQLRQRAPDLAIVAMSGGLGDRMGKGSALTAAIKIGAHRAVSKPFQREDLSTALRAALADVQGKAAGAV
ncbi:MAG: response regulator [Alphaproteobacteria bacterium]|nr:response regulator [Alphaproteobacteria bacterium]